MFETKIFEDEISKIKRIEDEMFKVEVSEIETSADEIFEAFCSRLIFYKSYYIKPKSPSLKCLRHTYGLSNTQLFASAKFNAKSHARTHQYPRVKNIYK